MAAPKPVKDIQVTFIGKKYDVDSATTAEDVAKKVMPDTTDSSKLPQVIFGGKKLEPTAFLRDAGVTDGAKLSMVPDPSASMQDLMKQAGLDSEKLDELMGSLGGGAGGDGEMPSMEESMKMMSSMMNSPMIQEMLSDPERLEQSRQMILQNPMLKVGTFQFDFSRTLECQWLYSSLANIRFSTFVHPSSSLHTQQLQ